MKKEDKVVYYIGFYGDQQSFEENRYLAPSAVNKMGYIAKSMSSTGAKVKILSMAWIKKTENRYFSYKSSRCFYLDDSVECLTLFSFISKFKVFEYLSMLFNKIWLIVFLLLKIKSDDVVVVYHSPFYFRTLLYLSKIRKINITLEIEEVYSKVFAVNKKSAGLEYKVINCASSYLLSNDLMKESLGLLNKKTIIIYGVYEPVLQESTTIFNDGKIHVVYAGVIDKLKRGAFNAVEASKFLSNRYVLHVLGFGLDDDISDLKRLIIDINVCEDYQCEVVYEGKKLGDEYINFIKSCHIGLSTQRNDGEYLLYTFPSKILSYLTLGVRVVTGDMLCLRESSIDDLLKYYESDNPADIADAISKINISEDFEGIRVINDLDKRFREEVKELIW
ncbi:hypothetical protein [Myroides marinus]|uniref:hypothetical protein n=1 Tax=Myroides marinus TaxID=703342 RepID=UPI002576E889|nr:hypothetical protein [Myroides marinus]MDM1376771.1 hypothetical protein [Myroides marinus]